MFVSATFIDSFRYNTIISECNDGHPTTKGLKMQQPLVSILLLCCINQILCGDVTYLDLSELESTYHHPPSSYSRTNDRAPRRHLDIYTNHPDVETVLDNYRTISRRHNKMESYYLPETNYHRYSSGNRRKIETPEGDEFTFSDDNFVYLQSQKYVDPETNHWPKTTPYSFHYPLTERPQFQTRKNRTPTKKHPVRPTNIQKIPKPTPNPTTSKHTNINEILKKYIAKLYGQKQKRPKKRTTHSNKKLTVTKNAIKTAVVHGKFLEEPLMALKNKTIKFAHKFLSLFTIVQFPNSRCQANGASGDYEGTCYHATECDSLNGTAFGECAEGYGVCCVCK